MGRPITIRPLAASDADAAVEVINEAARWYRDFLPPEEYHEPEMSRAEWMAEARRLAWYGAFATGRLLGVMGLEPSGDAILLRHAYVQPGEQRRGLGVRLVEHLEAEARRVHPSARRIIVGTYRANTRARGALDKLGYRPSPEPEHVLRAHYAIPEDRLRASLTYEKPLGGPSCSTS
ncbi:MAG: GNAT family N-acetyltransferase [Actinobacteria bacterium]|nr:GNAT family N-acetyltransferase [Actinomycetota bacterium]